MDVHDPSLLAAEANGEELKNHVGIVRGKEMDNAKRIDDDWDVKKEEKRREEAERKAEVARKSNFRYLAKEREKAKKAKLAMELKRKSMTMKGMKFSSKGPKVKST